jgi:hypothetical protein
MREESLKERNLMNLKKLEMLRFNKMDHLSTLLLTQSGYKTGKIS